MRNTAKTWKSNLVFIGFALFLTVLGLLKVSSAHATPPTIVETKATSAQIMEAAILRQLEKNDF